MSAKIVVSYAAPAELPSSCAEPRGSSPSGTMTIIRINRRCPGFSDCQRCLQIDYDIPGGTQAIYHPNPGRSFPATRRRAYLPDNADGRSLLSRLACAWKRGLLFDVGTSLTTGKSDVVTWASVPHKTSLHGGRFGWPDHSFLAYCRAVLSSLGVPDDCRELVAHISPASSTFPVSPAPSLIPASSVSPCIVPPCTTTPTAPVHTNSPTTAVSPTTEVSPISAVFPIAAVSPKPPPVLPILPAPAISAPPRDSGLPPARRGSKTWWTSSSSIKEDISYDAPPSKKDIVRSLAARAASSSSAEVCSVCLEDLLSNVVEMELCGHAFHRECILQCLDCDFKCPVCRGPLGEPRGYSPSGTMSVRKTNKVCPGFLPAKALSIKYEIPSGVQKDYHDDPGKSYEGTTRVAYLPHNDEGLHLLRRLKYAWKHGMTFRIGTSVTTGKSGVVTWTSIHHKTSLFGGAHGFPDAKYLDNCHAALDALHVPPM